MKRVNIRSYHLGLLYRKQEFIGVLESGTHWLSFWDHIEIFDTTTPMPALSNIDILLENENFLACVQVDEINDGEIGIQYVDDKFIQIVSTGRYCHWNSIKSYRYEVLNIQELEVPADINPFVLQLRALAIFIQFVTIQAYEKALLIVDGKLVQELSMGVYRYWKNGRNVQVLKVDLRQKQIEISGQELLTKDKAGLRISLYAHYAVTDIYKALLDNQEYEKQLYVLLHLAIRKFVGTKSLDELLANKESLAEAVLKDVGDHAISVGVEVRGVGVRDIILPGEMKAIMNQVLIAEKQAQSNSIMRREETASTRSLLNTAKLMEDNQMLLKLKEMEYVEKIADKINTISLSGGGQVIDQLRELFVTK